MSDTVTNGLVSINELITGKFHFNIPSYQRGYRWGAEQIEALLNDLLDFRETGSVNEYYCLQPLVVKKNGQHSETCNIWDVVDGQQRLTTAVILLEILQNPNMPLDNIPITYDTREGSEAYLKNITPEKANDNIDFFHMYKAKQTAFQWLKQQKPSAWADIFSVLTRKTKFIWYEIAAPDPIEIFTNLNVGKISLTNAELVKGLLLNGSHGNTNEEIELKQIAIALQWDMIESKLQDDKFWYFIAYSNDANKYNTRIDFIFDILCQNIHCSIDIPSRSKYRTFFIISNYTKESDKSDKGDPLMGIWDNARKIFNIFVEWYNDQTCYHYIGYIIYNNLANHQTLLDLYDDNNKEEFKGELKKIVTNSIKLNSDKIASLSFDESNDKKLINQLLLLFNLITYEKAGLKFPFNQFINEAWSLEHIHAQNQEELPPEKLISWLKSVAKNIDDADLREQIETADTLSLDDQRKLEAGVTRYFGEAEIHTIDNLALLSTKLNSSLSNGIFPDKRAIIIHEDKQAQKFIPLCTRNVFLKYYSPDTTSTYKWDKDDRNMYLASMLQDFKTNGIIAENNNG